MLARLYVNMNTHTQIAHADSALSCVQAGASAGTKPKPCLQTYVYGNALLCAPIMMAIATLRVTNNMMNTKGKKKMGAAMGSASANVK